MAGKWFFIIVLVFCCAMCEAQPSGDEILAKIESNYSGIQDYTVGLDVSVDLERLKVPEMKAVMYFKRPDKIHFESEGFTLLPKEGIGFASGDLRSRFNVDDMKIDRDSVLLTLRPKQDRTKLRKIFAKVNPVHWTIERLSMPQFDGRQMKGLFDYQQIGGRWLPTRLTVTFTSDTTETDVPDLFSQLPAAQRPSQVPRKGTITIRYSDYKINTGLSDDIFMTK